MAPRASCLTTKAHRSWPLASAELGLGANNHLTDFPFAIQQGVQHPAGRHESHQQRTALEVSEKPVSHRISPRPKRAGFRLSSQSFVDKRRDSGFYVPY